MPFLPLNQQCQSTEDATSITLISFPLFPVSHLELLCLWYVTLLQIVGPHSFAYEALFKQVYLLFLCDIADMTLIYTL